MFLIYIFELYGTIIYFYDGEFETTNQTCVLKFCKTCPV